MAGNGGHSTYSPLFERTPELTAVDREKRFRLKRVLLIQCLLVQYIMGVEVGLKCVLFGFSYVINEISGEF